VTDFKSDDEKIIAQLEQHGEAQVRLLISSGSFPTHLNTLAVKWLKQKDEEAQQRSEAYQNSQMHATLSARNAAWVAAVAALLALGVAVLQWLWPR
jgi:hypothetical protein